MAKSMWTGHLGWGLVMIPVSLFKANEDHDVGFHWHHGTRCRGRVGYNSTKVCKECGKDVPNEDVTSGTEVDGKVVIVTQDEKDSLADSIAKQIEILKFIGINDVDPMQFEGNSYYIGSALGEKSYTLLAQSMTNEGVSALVKFALRTKIQLGVVRVVNGRLILHPMRWPDEIRVPEGIKGPGADFTTAEMKMAQDVVKSMIGEYDPDAHGDDYQEKLRELVAAKAEGEPYKPEAAVELDSTDVDDLLEKLKKSVKRKRAPRRKVA